MKGRITMERHYGLTAEGIKEALEQGYSYKELMEEIEEMIAEEEEDLAAFPGIDLEYETWLDDIGEDPWGGKW